MKAFPYGLLSSFEAPAKVESSEALPSVWKTAAELAGMGLLLLGMCALFRFFFGGRRGIVNNWPLCSDLFDRVRDRSKGSTLRQTGAQSSFGKNTVRPRTCRIYGAVDSVFNWD